MSKKKESSAHIKFYLRQLFYGPTLNFLYVCALLVYFLMNAWHCDESHCSRVVGSQVLLRHRFCVSSLQENQGRCDRESGTMLNSQRQDFTKLNYFLIIKYFFIINSFSLQREVRVEHSKFAIQAIK